MMRKRHLLALLLLSAVQMVYAAPVKQSTAAQTAKSFFAAKGKVLKTTNAAYAPQRRLKSATKEVAPYYVFNAGNNNGFVIVSGDDRIQPILGYVDSGSFDLNKIPDNMRDFLKTYSEQVAELDAENKTIGGTSSQNAIQSRRAVEPLVKCNWNQDAPYYNACPKGTKGQTVTGCVATAMAQVMYYYQWPNNITKEIPAYKIKGETGHYSGTVAKVDAGTAIDWANLKLEKYTSGSTTAQKEAISKLMAYIGSSVQMVYDYAEYGGSGAMPSDIAPAFNDYFNYSASFLDRSKVTAQEFEDAMYNEVAHNRPVIFNGSQADGGGGHCFVLDGYNGNGLFHINWGWGGIANGYFAIPILNPDESGIGAGSGSGGYAVYQSAIIGINKGVQAENRSTRIVSEFVRINGAAITTRLFHYSDKTQDVDCAIGVREENTTNTPALNTEIEKFSITPGYYSRPTQFILKNLTPNKKYKAYILLRQQGTTAWSWDESNFVDVSVDAQGIIKTAYNKVYNDSKSLEVVRLEPFIENIVNGFAKAQVTIKNKSQKEYNGTIGVATAKSYIPGYGLTYKIYKARPILLQAGEELSFDLDYAFTQAGPQKLYLVTGNNKLLKQQEVNVDAEVESSTVETKFSFKDDVRAIVGDNVVGSVKITAKDAPITSGLLLALVKGGYIYKSFPTSVKLETDGVKEIPFNFQDVAPGAYNIALLRYDATNKGLGFCGKADYISVRSTVVSYKKDGKKEFALYTNNMTFDADVVAVDLTKVSPTSIKPGANPNTLYYVGNKNITGLENANKVLVNRYSPSLPVAEKIVLDDNYSFACPIAFVAKDVKYSRQFTNSYAKGKGWETIALPFNVQKVSINGEAIDWYKTKDETGKNFWLLSYDGQENDDVCFRYAPEFLANTPYVMGVPEKMKNVNIDFTATNVQFEVRDLSATQGANYTYFGSYRERTVQDAYTINATGDKFEKLGTAVKPFRGYFAGKGTAATLNLKAIGYDVAGIDNIAEDGTFAAPQAVFDLQGRKVATIKNASELNNLPKGIYVVKGKKMVVK